MAELNIALMMENETLRLENAKVRAQLDALLQHRDLQQNQELSEDMATTVTPCSFHEQVQPLPARCAELAIL